MQDIIIFQTKCNFIKPLNKKDLGIHTLLLLFCKLHMVTNPKLLITDSKCCKTKNRSHYNLIKKVVIFQMSVVISLTNQLML